MSQPLLEANAAAASFYRLQLLNRPDGWAARHLRDRGLAAILDPASSWRVGLAPDGWSRLVGHLRRDGFNDEVIVAAGLASVTKTGYLLDRFRDRIVFVAHDSDLCPVGFIGRARGTRLRYLNTPNTNVYSKTTTLVGLDGQLERLRAGADPVFVEGPMDASAVDLAGDEWAGAACCGTAVTRAQALIAKKYSQLNTVIVALDGDIGGRTGAVRSIDVLSEVFGEVLFARLPDQQDPASLYAADRSRLRDVLNSALPLVDFAIEVELARWNNVLDHVSGQVNAVRAVAPLVARLPVGRVASEVARLARAVRLDQQIVSREVIAAVGQRNAWQRRRPRRLGLERAEVEVDPADYSRSP
ncbi:toprim domain-containing protein (plasmid) [Kribbella sp. CWNU-51]